MPPATLEASIALSVTLNGTRIHYWHCTGHSLLIAPRIALTRWGAGGSFSWHAQGCDERLLGARTQQPSGEGPSLGVGRAGERGPEACGGAASLSRPPAPLIVS